MWLLIPQKRESLTKTHQFEKLTEFDFHKMKTPFESVFELAHLRQLDENRPPLE